MNAVHSSEHLCLRKVAGEHPSRDQFCLKLLVGRQALLTVRKLKRKALHEHTDVCQGGPQPLARLLLFAELRHRCRVRKLHAITADRQRVRRPLLALADRAPPSARTCCARPLCNHLSTVDGTTTHRARVVWHGGKEDLRAHTIQLADQTLAGSSAPDRGGDPTKADPEELFVAALSACHMLWLLYFARRAHLRIISYEDNPEGVMNDKCFLAVVLRPRVEFEIDVSRDALDKLHSEAHAACFIANSVTCQVTIAPPEVAD